MSVVFTTTAAISGLAAAVLSTKLLHDKRNKARAQALNNLIDKDFKPTHKHLDAKGRYLLAFDMTSASVFVAEIGKLRHRSLSRLAHSLACGIHG